METESDTSPQSDLTACPFGENLQRYWDRLSSLERRMALDQEALYSLTPQSVAEEIAAQVPGNTVIDAFCGAGGLTIALARQGKQVIAIDRSTERLDMARTNARLFGVAEDVEFHAGDAPGLLPELTADAVVLDPPWGGPNYAAADEFVLSHFNPPGDELLQSAFAVTDNVVMRLPKNFRIDELDRFGRSYHLQENCMEERLLHYTAFWTSR